MFKIIGWLMSALVLGYGSITYVIIMANGMSKYNIGGIKNKVTTKVGLLVGALVFVYLWYLVGVSTPFEMTLG